MLLEYGCKGRLWSIDLLSSLFRSNEKDGFLKNWTLCSWNLTDPALSDQLQLPSSTMDQLVSSISLLVPTTDGTVFDRYSFTSTLWLDKQATSYLSNRTPYRVATDLQCGWETSIVFWAMKPQSDGSNESSNGWNQQDDLETKLNLWRLSWH